MQNVSQVEPSPISAELRAVIEESARRAAVTAGAMSIANPSAAELPGEYIWRVQERMLISLESKFGRRLASRVFWDVRRATRLKGACRRGLYHFGPTEDWPRHLRILVVMLRINDQLQRFLRLLDIPLMRGQCSGAWEATIPAHVMPAFRAMGSQ